MYNVRRYSKGRFIVSLNDNPLWPDFWQSFWQIKGRVRLALSNYGYSAVEESTSKMHDENDNASALCRQNNAQNTAK